MFLFCGVICAVEFTSSRYPFVLFGEKNIAMVKLELLKKVII